MSVFVYITCENHYARCTISLKNAACGSWRGLRCVAFWQCLEWHFRHDWHWQLTRYSPRWTLVILFGGTGASFLVLVVFLVLLASKIVQYGEFVSKTRRDVLLFNRVPKSGTELIAFLLQKLQAKNHFQHIRLVGGNAAGQRRLNATSQVMSIRQLNEKMRSYSIRLTFILFSSGSSHAVYFLRKESPSFSRSAYLLPRLWISRHGLAHLFQHDSPSNWKDSLSVC